MRVGTVDAAGVLSEMAGRIENLTGCMLARDGLILEVVPESQQTAIRGAWMRFSAVGGFEKGYLQFDGELWICVQKGPYELFVLARPGAKPGLILDVAHDCLERVEDLAPAVEELVATGTTAAATAAEEGKGKRERPARSVSWIRVGNPEPTEGEEGG